MATYKALYTISCCLQDCPPLRKTQTPMSSAGEMIPYGASPDTHAESSPQILPHSKGYSIKSRKGYSVSVNANTVATQDMKDKLHEVVFRLLCSDKAAGGVIGKKGTVVKSLEDKTGALITFSALMTNCDERVITISATEVCPSSHTTIGFNSAEPNCPLNIRGL